MNAKETAVAFLGAGQNVLRGARNRRQTGHDRQRIMLSLNTIH